MPEPLRGARLVLLVAACVLAAACGGDDDAGSGGDGDGGGGLSAEEQELADAWSLTLQDEDDGFAVGQDDADCMGAAIMLEVGVEPFEEADVTADDIGDDEGQNSPGEVLGAGVISEAQADAVLDAWEECVDLAQMLAESASTEFDLDEDGVACFADGLGEGELARDVLRPSFTSDSDDPPEEALGSIVALLDSCGDGEGGLLVDSIAEELAADGSMCEDVAGCFAQAVYDDLGFDRLAELSASGDFEDADPEAQSEITGALIAAAGACDVPVSAFGG